MAARSEHQAIGLQLASASQAKAEATAREGFGSLQRLTLHGLNAGPPGCPPQGVHHRAGSVGTGKQASISLFHQL